MEKQISNFGIENIIPKGENIRSVICKKCNYINTIKTNNKIRFSKINTVICKKCKEPISIGDIYNFKTGSKLRDLLVNHNQELYDKQLWNSNYDRI